MASGKRTLRFLVEDQQVMHLRRVVILELVNFLLRNLPLLRQRRGGGILRVLVQAISIANCAPWWSNSPPSMSM